MPPNNNWSRSEIERAAAQLWPLDTLQKNRSMNLAGGRERLARAAYSLKKAWLLCAAIIGFERLRPRLTVSDLTVPNYSRWSRTELNDHVAALEEDLNEILREVIQLEGGRKRLHEVARWLAQHFDRWQENDGGLYTISTVFEFEHHAGRLRSRERMETPAYAEMLVQGVHGLAIRHPEYMLVRDLGLLFDLHNDADCLLDGASSLRDEAWATATGENRQSLARAVILTCFNLLEAFTNGLAREWLMFHRDGHDERRRQLEDMQKPLRTRLVVVVQAVSGGRCSLDVNKPPMSTLFGRIKERRDAFVHCEPGPQPSARGYAKEAAFHDVPPSVVTETVQLSFDVIRTAWRDVHQRDGPLWLPPWEGKRFGKPNVRLVASASRKGV